MPTTGIDMALARRLVAALSLFGVPTRPRVALLLSARDDVDGRHYAVGYHLNGRQAFAIEVPQRCHAVAEHPNQPVALFVARRPGTHCYLLDLQRGRLLQTLQARPHRHFYGHAVAHRGGEWFYTTENDTREPGRGLLGIYRFDGQQLRYHSEVPTHGIGPHELAWMPDGETLVVANGGIRTEAESRADMNLDAMQASLVLMRRNGTLVSKETLSQPMNSIRHLAVGGDGTVVACQQYMGSAQDTAELLAIKRPGNAFKAFPVAPEQLRGMAHYTASVALHDRLRLVALTAPRANRLFIWGLDSGLLRLQAYVPDCAGVAAVAEGFVASSGQGRCRHYDCRGPDIKVAPLALPSAFWDNHLYSRVG
ncbi:DUF1513 domain-containing protein [Pseudomonas sp. C2L12B]|uniref:DUF1513 domain-containing protein n=2 Tax=Pseudomonas typographi TaxID=2715964 RepID=A0ABR7YWF6_9PSED|nr:DUF1513 domain-containing protein [Pseudomonas typographi]MBD1597471.1 DUF1513 domain-containing protein [Pseudomonas typographi]